MEGIRVEALTDFPTSPAWAAEWESLLTRSATDEVFCSYEWMRACAEFDAKRQPLVLAGFDRGRLIGLMPLAKRQVRRGLGTHRRLEFLALPWADYCDVIAEPAAQEEFLKRCLEYLQEHASEWDEIGLANLPEGSKTASVFARLAEAAGLRASVRPTHVGPVLDLSGASREALDELLEKKGVVRKAKALGRKGRLEFKVLRAEAELQWHLNDFCRFHTVRSLLHGQPSVFDPEDPGSLSRLLHLLTERLSPAGKVCLPALFLDGRPIAFYFGFEHHGRWTLYATTFDPGLVGTSPGEILTLEVARYCRAAGIRELDFGIGSEAYKFRFTNRERRNCELVICRGAWAACASAIKEKAKNWAKQRPRLFEVLRQGQRLAHLARLEWRRVGLKHAAASLLSGAGRRLVGWINPRPTQAAHFHASDWRRAATGEELKFSEVAAGDLVTMVMAHRQALPPWYLGRMLDYLRQGHRCLLAETGGRLTQVVWVNGAGRVEASQFELLLSGRGLEVYEIWPVAAPPPAGGLGLPQAPRSH